MTHVHGTLLPHLYSCKYERKTLCPARILRRMSSSRHVPPCPAPGHPLSVPLLPAFYPSKRSNFRALVGGTQGGAETAGECKGHVRIRGETGAVRRYERLFRSRGDASFLSFMSKALLSRNVQTRRRFMAVRSEFAILPPLIRNFSRGGTAVSS